jgi:hypothetical protein
MLALWECFRAYEQNPEDFKATTALALMGTGWDRQRELTVANIWAHLDGLPEVTLKDIAGFIYWCIAETESGR